MLIIFQKILPLGQIWTDLSEGRGGFLLVIGQGELAKSAGSESNSCEQLLSPNYIDNYVHFVMVMQFVKYSTFYLIKFNYIHCFVV